MMSDTYCGSTAYVAPEVLKAQPYNALVSDIWSMGVVLFVLVQSRLPFSDRDSKKLLAAQLNREYKYAKPVPSKECKDLIEIHLDPNPSVRKNMNEIFEHAWFKDNEAADGADE